MLLDKSTQFVLPSDLQVIDVELVTGAFLAAKTRVWVALITSINSEVGHTSATGGAVAVTVPTFEMPALYPDPFGNAAGEWALTATLSPL